MKKLLPGTLVKSTFNDSNLGKTAVVIEWKHAKSDTPGSVYLIKYNHEKRARTQHECFLEVIAKHKEETMKKVENVPCLTTAQVEKFKEAGIDHLNKYMIEQLEQLIFGGKARPIQQIGSGRWKQSWDHTVEMVRLIKLMGIEFECGNDAPRKGKHGAYIIAPGYVI